MVSFLWTNSIDFFLLSPHALKELNHKTMKVETWGKDLDLRRISCCKNGKKKKNNVITLMKEKLCVM